MRVDAVAARESTRRTLVSTAATCRSHANEPTAAAVYGPTPGKLGQIGRPAVLGDDAAAAFCSASARRL